MKPELLANVMTATMPVGSGDLLGRRSIGIESINNSTGERDILALGAVNDPCVELAEMLNYPGPIAVLVEALKREGVRFDESSFPDENITRQNPYVAIIRGEAAEFLHRACESIKSRATTQQAGQSGGLPLTSDDGGMRHVPDSTTSQTLCVSLEIVHKRSRPNEKADV